MIVDAQVGFAGYGSDLIDAITNELSRLSKDDVVIVVEYNGFGSTGSEVMEAVRSSSCKWFVVSKVGDDGSEAVLSCCARNDLTPKAIRLVGLYRNWCVKSTAIGLAMKRPDATVIVSLPATSDASWNGWVVKGSGRLLVEGVRSYKNIRVAE